MRQSTHLPPIDADKLTFIEDAAIDGRAERILLSGENPRNVYSYFRGLFQTRLYLGNEQILIAFGSPRNCMRVADCALYYFWPYRRKPNRPINDTDLNFSIAAASRELKENQPLRTHLETLELELTRINALDPARKRKPRARITRLEFIGAWAQFKQACDDVKLTLVEKNLRAHEDALAAQLEQIGKLVSGIDHSVFGA